MTGSGTPLVRGFNCPNCGSAVELRAGEHALTAVCPSCLSVLDAKDPNFRVLQTMEEKIRVKPRIPLGTRGTIMGATFQVIGFQVRSIVVEGERYSWYEYLLFNPYRGFRYLTEYQGHWNAVVTVHTVPLQQKNAVMPTATLDGVVYRHFQSAKAYTDFVLGEFPWQVRTGDSAETRDYVAPPRMLSAETTDNETTWSRGEYIKGDDVWKAFKLPGQAPPAVGIFANQPSPYGGGIGRVWKAFVMLMIALTAMFLLREVSARREQAFSGQFVARPGVNADSTSFVTAPFELKGHSSNVELTTSANLNNGWIFVDYALINEQTGVSYEVAREASYYYGSDSDGNWSEGSQSDRAIIPSVPSGRYFLRVAPEVAPEGSSVTYNIRVRRDVPNALFFGVAMLLLFIPPIILSIRAAAFEGQRWKESDRGTAISSAIASASESSDDSD